MRRPRILPILIDLIQATISSCEGLVFDQCCACPSCGGWLTGYDREKKQFAVLTDGETTRTIFVIVKRFRCTDCKKICSADAPFYPKTRFGSPVVDLCITLGQVMPYSRVSTYLACMGILVDRWTVRKYVLNNRHRAIATNDLYGQNLPRSLVSLSTLVARANGEKPDPQELLAVLHLKHD